MYKKYLSEGKDPIPAYPQITKADWAEFKRVRATKEFAEKSFKQSGTSEEEHTPPTYGCGRILWHETDMGTGGQRSSSGGWESGFSEIKGECAIDYLRARVKRRDDRTYYF